MKKNETTGFYHLYIDTGGTFTDCLATAPGGEIIRCKVLSSSALRGSAKAGKQPDQVVLSFGEDTAQHFFKGYKFRISQHPQKSFTITGSRADGNRCVLDLDSDAAMDSGGDTLCEIQSPEEAPVLATRLVTGTPLEAPLPPVRLRLSTTKGTNALLERRGGATLYLITEGFKDLLHIKNQQRPDLFSLDIHRPEPFYKHIVEVPERLDAAGNVINPVDLQELRKRVEPLAKDVEAAGICLMHSYLNPAHELRAEELLREVGVRYISRSSALSPTIKMVPRAVTTDINAALSPVMERYLNRISGVIGSRSFHVMSSAGSLVRADAYTPKDGLLSGPAGGVIGAVAIGERVRRNLRGFSENPAKIISFDMGGTSTDVARYDGEIETVYEHTVGDAALAAPAVDIETVAAGGGSVCGFDGQSLTAGPESAGADPGPACYGQGGPLTITDVNLLSGRLDPSNFHISVLPEAAEKAFSTLQNQINTNRKIPMTREEILEGFLDIANERMAQAIRKISIQKGFDPGDYTLVAFGGAGAQHATAVAGKLKIRNVLVPSDAGLLSAYGLQQARMEQIESKQILASLTDISPQLPALFEKLSARAVSRLRDQGVERQRITVSRKRIFMRFEGQDSSLEIDYSGPDALPREFKKAYTEQYGHWMEDRSTEVEAIRVTAAETQGKSETPSGQAGVEAERPGIRPEKNANFLSGKKLKEALVFRHNTLQSGSCLDGPALILHSHSTTVIEPDWRGTLLEDGTWFLEAIHKPSGGLEPPEGLAARDEAVNLQLYTNRFRSAADQMGEMLRKTSLSVNVKERLDFSCALLDRDGYLVVNAPHIPVHLGAMGSCVRTLIKNFDSNSGRNEFAEGDVLITNHPGYGGSHLPDVTVVTPVFFEGRRIGFAASRAHHAEIGGKRPGSMPPDATNLAEEGVVIPPSFLARKGEFDWDSVRRLLLKGPWPSRSPEENLADLQAAAAANHRGAAELKKLAGTFGVNEVTDYMQRLKTYASARMRSTLEKLPDGDYFAAEELDDGWLLKVNCLVDSDSMTIDFTGTGGVHPGNLNANPSIVNSVVMYVLRLMVDEPLPLNDGLLEPVKLIIPEGMLNPPFPDNPAACPAVVGGNIETSQRLTDTLLKAFGMAACSYGTMNNVLFGNKTFGYYETVAGGTGAGKTFGGADAVHQHMTNTRAADPEILEHRYPVRLDRYAIRKGSGGKGARNGGNGIIREMTFTGPVSLSVLAQHRVVPPYGLDGGMPGRRGKHFIQRKDGSRKQLAWRDGADLNPGDRFILHTPGGGGFGKEKRRNR